MINKLTKHQESQLQVVADEWLNKVFKYELHNSVTFESCKKATKELYKFCELKEPIVLLLDSPLACHIAANMFKGLNLKQVWAQVRDQVRDQVWEQVRAQVREQVREQVWEQVRDQVRDQVWEQVRGSRLEYINFSSHGNFGDFWWLPFYDYFFKNTKVKIEKELLQNFQSVKKWVQQSFISIQLDGLCIVSRSPKFISRDSQNNLHNTKGYAIEFSDGFGLHYINGRYVEPELFAKCQELKKAKKMFFSIINEDARAIIITIIKENYGSKGVLDMLGAKVVDERVINHDNGHSETVRLYKTKESYDFLQDHYGNMGQPYAWVEMTCPSTGSTYLIDTSAAFDKAIDAVKFARPSFIPTNIEYNWLEFTN